MIYSQFNFLSESKKNKVYFLYNSYTNSFMKISKELYLNLKKVKNDNNSIHLLEENIEDLKQAKVIVNQGEDKDIINEIRYNYYQQAFDKSVLALTIAPTIDCNFKCFYCYEQNEKKSMSPEVEKKLIEFIRSYKDVEKVDITWYGGEPLMKFNSIKRITEELKNVNVVYQLITNGYLLDEKTCQFFNKHPLDSVQITIDGDESSHDKRRILHNGAPTFKIILNNIDRFITTNKDTLVNIRVNLDNSNIGKFPEIYNILKSKGDNIHIYPAFVTDHTENCSLSGITCSKELKFDFYKELYQKYDIPINFYPEHSVGGCGATMINGFVIDPEGNLFKCWHDIDKKNMRIGTIFNKEIENIGLLSRYLGGENYLFDDKCQNCSFLPICTGICSYYRIENNYKDKVNEVCPLQKHYFEEYLELSYEHITNEN